MNPRLAQFGGGATQTVLHPAVLVAMIVTMVLFFVLPRRDVIVPILLSTFLIPLGQQFYVLGVHLFVYRLLILVAFIRAMAEKAPKERSHFAGGWNSIDTAFTCYVIVSATATLMLNQNGSALINQIGYLWDYLLGYLLPRSLIQNERDSLLVIKCFAGLMMLLAIAMLVEQMKMINVFGVLGGVAVAPEVRDGKIRSQGAFQHALTAGAFATISIPLLILLWKRGRSKPLAIIGLVAATVMTITTQTSTSLLTYGAGVFAIMMWPLRNQMKRVRLTVTAILVTLQLVMKAPVWFLMARIDLTGSSSSYQRANLIDQFVNHFSNWWLLGTKDAASWGWDMWDSQNMFVSVGQTGGLAALIFYVLVISRSFARVGNARRRAASTKQEWLFWLLGATLFANVVAFLGVNYFDQVRMAWFALISMICACTLPASSTERKSMVADVRIKVQIADECSGDDLPCADESQPDALRPPRLSLS